MSIFTIDGLSNEFIKKSHVWIFAVLLAFVGIGGAVLSLLIAWGGLAVLQDILSILPKKILVVFIATLLASVFSSVLMLKFAVFYIAKKTAIAESEVKYYAIALSAIGIIAFLISFLFIGDLWSGMGSQRFLFSGGAALGLGAVLFVTGIIWLDPLCKAVLPTTSRQFASPRDIALFLIVLALVGAMFFAAANRSYLVQNQRDRDTARMSGFPVLVAAIETYFRDKGDYPKDLKELSALPQDNKSGYLYHYCQEQGYYHLGVLLESKKSLALGMDRDYKACDEDDFSGQDPMLDVIGHADVSQAEKKLILDHCIKGIKAT
ncbi:MAG: hypothetical protein HYV77_01730 [Candidatus Wildermuthbacteria bacterium]|nr:hypothetical protein [Candidatus Wildermuthbacteria bacterium]